MKIKFIEGGESLRVKLYILIYLFHHVIILGLTKILVTNFAPENNQPEYLGSLICDKDDRTELHFA